MLQALNDGFNIFSEPDMEARRFSFRRCKVSMLREKEY